MRHTAIAASLTTIVTLALAAPNSTGTEAVADILELTHVACDAGHAYASRDLTTLDKLAAADYSQIDARGGVLKRLEWRDFVKNRKSDLAVECNDIEVRLYGGAALVTGSWTYTNRKPGGDVITHSRWTSVWTKDGEGWKRHAFQNTYVNPKADQCALNPTP